MTAPLAKRLAIPLLTLSTSLVFGACSCSVSVGDDDISAGDIESKAAANLQKQVGAARPPEIDCPDDLEAKVGESEQCTLTDPGNGDEYDMTATVKSVSGDEYDLSFQVASKPRD